MATPNKTCPKCQRDVTEQDHTARNVEPAVRLSAAEPGMIRGQVHWQHRVCSAN